MFATAVGKGQLMKCTTVFHRPVAQWGEAYAAVGLDQMSYVPATTPVAYNAWPTLQEMISSGKRLVSFMDYNADYSSVNYILDHCKLSIFYGRMAEMFGPTC